MRKEVFEKTINVRYSEMDHNLTLKPSALLNFLEDLASENAEQLGFGYSFVRKHNLAWVLLKYHMEFESYPNNIYDLTIKTEPRGYNRLFAFRDFELYSEEKLLGKIGSCWSLIDMSSRNIASVQQYLSENQYMYPFEKRNNDLTYEKIKPIQNIVTSKEYCIRYDDIDVNQHANNSNYIIWGFEPLEFDFRSNKQLKSLDMMFKKEIKYGNNIISQVEILDNKTLHAVKSKETGEDLCLISANWTNK